MGGGEDGLSKTRYLLYMYCLLRIGKKWRMKCVVLGVLHTDVACNIVHITCFQFLFEASSANYDSVL